MGPGEGRDGAASAEVAAATSTPHAAPLCHGGLIERRAPPRTFCVPKCGGTSCERLGQADHKPSSGSFAAVLRGAQIVAVAAFVELDDHGGLGTAHKSAGEAG